MSSTTHDLIKPLPSVAYPSVTVAIPAYNESEFIVGVLRAFCSSAYPNICEIFVANGGSTDDTASKVREMQAKDNRIRLIENPQRSQSAGLNLIFDASKSEVFLRADAHAEYASDYVEQCILALQESNAMNVGGSQRYIASTVFQAGISLASRSWLTGVAKYRDPKFNGFADTVFLGCFLRSALKQVAERQSGVLFDLKQVRNQDLELNLRIRELKRDAIYVSSKIRVGYFPRSSLRALFQQYFKDGRGSSLTAGKNLGKKPIRQRVPFLSLVTIFIVLCVDIILFRGGLYVFWIICLLGLIPLAEATRVTWSTRPVFSSEIWRGDPAKLPSIFIRFAICLTALFTMPIAYALGYGYQLARNRLFFHEGW